MSIYLWTHQVTYLSIYSSTHFYPSNFLFILLSYLSTLTLTYVSTNVPIYQLLFPNILHTYLYIYTFMFFNLAIYPLEYIYLVIFLCIYLHIYIYPPNLIYLSTRIYLPIYLRITVTNLGAASNHARSASPTQTFIEIGLSFSTALWELNGFVFLHLKLGVSHKMLRYFTKWGMFI